MNSVYKVAPGGRLAAYGCVAILYAAGNVGECYGTILAAVGSCVCQVPLRLTAYAKQLNNPPINA